MFRETNIRSEIESYLETLVDLYEETNPAKGTESEAGKLELARQAIEIHWRIFGRLMLWAQCHLTGYCIAKRNPHVVEILRDEFHINLTEDSHELEVLGLLYPCNPVDRDDPLLNKFEDRFENESEIMSNEALRDIIKELLMSRCANSSFWRFDLQTALRSLNEGEVEPILQPVKLRLRGKPASLNRWKLEALYQVHFRIGKGMKKHRALKEVADALAQSAETLRAWEKQLMRSEDRENDLYCAELAGEYDSELSDDGRHFSIPDHQDYGIHRGTWNAENAAYLHRVITKRTFKEIKDKIREYRDPKSSGTA